MSYITYYEDWPKLDDSLIQEALYIRDNEENIFPFKSSPYKLYLLNDLLKNFTSKFLKFNHKIHLHSFNFVPIHIDVNRTEAYNYIIDTGGPNVKTLFYNLNDFTILGPGDIKKVNENCEPVEAVSIRPNVWHKINVSVPHTVINIETVRTGLTITPI